MGISNDRAEIAEEEKEQCASYDMDRSPFHAANVPKVIDLIGTFVV